MITEAVNLLAPPPIPPAVRTWLPACLVQAIPRPPDTLTDTAALWWTSVVASTALIAFYEGLAMPRLGDALMRMASMAADGLANETSADEIHRPSALGQRMGHAAALDRDVELFSVVPWWAAGLRASYATAAISGLARPGHLNDPAVDRATHHHQKWRAGLVLLLDDETRSWPIIAAAYGAPDTPWVRVLAAAVLAEAARA